MLTIRTAARDTPTDPTALLRRDLLACHARIRRFTEVAARVARADGRSNADLVEAARALVDYFGRALPLHVLDEDESRRPRLYHLCPQAVTRMSAEHGPLEAVVATGVARWSRLADAPCSLPTMRGELLDLASRLELGFPAHLEAEEREIFPALELLGEDDIVAIRHEMRQRRR